MFVFRWYIYPRIFDSIMFSDTVITFDKVGSNDQDQLVLASVKSSGVSVL